MPSRVVAAQAAASGIANAVELLVLLVEGHLIDQLPGRPDRKRTINQQSITILLRNFGKVTPAA